MQKRFGADRLAVVLIDVDAAFSQTPDEFLPRANKVLKARKVTWPNAIAPGGFSDTTRTFNVSGYGKVVVDAKGIVRGLDVHGMELDHLVETILESKD